MPFARLRDDALDDRRELAGGVAAADADLAGLSEHVRRVCIEAYEHQDLLFEEVLDSLAARYPERDRTGPLFEAMLFMQEQAEETSLEEGLLLAPYQSASGALDPGIAATTCEFILTVAARTGEFFRRSASASKNSLRAVTVSFRASTAARW